MNANTSHQQSHRATLLLLILTVIGGVLGTMAGPPQTLAQDAAAPAIAKSIGLIKTINGNSITLSVEKSPDVSVTVLPNARILRLGADKDLKNATALTLADLQVGDRIRARGQGSSDGKSISALEVLVITSSAVAAVTDQVRQDWQKRGVAGVVRAVDAASGTVSIGIASFSGSKTVAVHTAKNTIIRRYSPDSVKFEDAKAGALADVHVGDQLRARGDRSADGTEVTAEEIVTGSFPYVEGIVKSVDASAGTLTVQDVVSKKAVLVRVTADSQLHKIPAEMANRFAMRLKGGTSGAGPGGNAPGGQASPGQPGAAPPNGTAPAGAPAGGATAGGPGGTQAGGAPGGMRSGGAPDFQQILSRLPASTLAGLNLQKGDAVVILATEGTPTTGNTAITLLSGVEPILQASPNASQAMMLAPWSLGGSPGGDQ